MFNFYIQLFAPDYQNWRPPPSQVDRALISSPVHLTKPNNATYLWENGDLNRFVVINVLHNVSNTLTGAAIGSQANYVGIRQPPPGFNINSTANEHNRRI